LDFWRPQGRFFHPFSLRYSTLWLKLEENTDGVSTVAFLPGGFGNYPMDPHNNFKILTKIKKISNHLNYNN